MKKEACAESTIKAVGKRLRYFLRNTVLGNPEIVRDSLPIGNPLRTNLPPIWWLGMGGIFCILSGFRRIFLWDKCKTTVEKDSTTANNLIFAQLKKTIRNLIFTEHEYQA